MVLFACLSSGILQNVFTTPISHANIVQGHLLGHRPLRASFAKHSASPDTHFGQERTEVPPKCCWNAFGSSFGFAAVRPVKRLINQFRLPVGTFPLLPQLISAYSWGREMGVISLGNQRTKCWRHWHMPQVPKIAKRSPASRQCLN